MPAELVPIAPAGDCAVVVPRAVSLSLGPIAGCVRRWHARSGPAGLFKFRSQPHRWVLVDLVPIAHAGDCAVAVARTASPHRGSTAGIEEWPPRRVGGPR